MKLWQKIFLYTMMLVMLAPKNATIEGNAFGGTPWLEKQGDWVVINGSLIAYKGTEIDITIPNGVTSLGDGWCQYGGGDVRSVTLPNSVTKIGAGAFWYFSGISSIDIPNSVIQLEAYIIKSDSSSFLMPPTQVVKQCQVIHTRLHSITSGTHIGGIFQYGQRNGNYVRR